MKPQLTVVVIVAVLLAMIVAITVATASMVPCFAEADSDAKATPEDVAAMTEMIAKHPTAGNYAQRGRLYAILNMHQKSVDDYSSAIKLAPTAAGLYWRRGLAIVSQNKFSDALLDFNKTLELAQKGDFDYMQGLRGRCHCYEELGRQKDMLADMRELSALADQLSTEAVQRWEHDHKAGAHP